MIVKWGAHTAAIKKQIQPVKTKSAEFQETKQLLFKRLRKLTLQFSLSCGELCLAQ
jgi:hypothetical protein